MTAYPNSGEPELVDLKRALWGCAAPCWIETGIKGLAFRLTGPTGDVCARLDEDGRLHVLKGYIFDGSSVPLFGRWLDYRTSAWPAAVHDVAYEALRAGKLHPDERQRWDALYRDMLKAFGAYWLTSRVAYVALRLFGGSSAARAREYEKRKAA